jgi:hypothetical protein
MSVAPSAPANELRLTLSEGRRRLSTLLSTDQNVCSWSLGTVEVPQNSDYSIGCTGRSESDLSTARGYSRESSQAASGASTTPVQ